VASPRIRRPFKIALALVAIVMITVAACVASVVVHTNNNTHKAKDTARAQLDELHADDLGHVVGTGAFGTTGLGDPPTAFVAVEIRNPSTVVLAEVGSRLETNGYTLRFKCNPSTGCTWEKRHGGHLISARAFVYDAGQTWGRKSTDHGVVSPSARVLEIDIIVGG